MLVIKLVLRPNHLQLTSDRVELHTLHNLEFPPVVMLYEQRFTL